MENLDKIKALQQKAGIEADGIATVKTWVSIYTLLFSFLPNQYSISAIIKAIQQKLNIRVTGRAGEKTWDAIYQFLIGDVETNHTRSAITNDPHNEIILQGMTKEVIPFAKELINLAANQGIHIRLMNCISDESQTGTLAKENNLQHQVFNDSKTSFSSLDFGLVFDIGIFEKTNSGEMVLKDNSQLYAKVAKLGESIGLTWAGNRRSFTSLPHFELRPAWALRMAEDEMMRELHRRKNENINLLAIL